MIELRQVTKIFQLQKPVVALHDVTLQISGGEMVAVMGASGSGKSTLLNLIGGLDRPTRGHVLVDRQDLNLLKDDALTRLRREKIGFIFQFFNLIATLTAIQNVTLPFLLRGMHRAEVEQKASRLLDLVGLAGRADHLPDELSGGEQQRVAIARALAFYPPVVLADEPTGNLDSQTGIEILNLLCDVQQRFQTTIVMVTHDEKAASFCRRVVLLKDGEIVEDSGGVSDCGLRIAD
ncbi:MAG TPA: ABC transporter ATP-binding protein [Acidobacteriota bacterium]|nr:ABC transporter ATP-binding protein [Acidobacteriota bacterium]